MDARHLSQSILTLVTKTESTPDPRDYQSQLVWLVSLLWRCPSYTSLVLELKIASKAVRLLVDSGRLTSGPHACKGRTSSTELSLQPQTYLSSAVFLFSHAPSLSCSHHPLAPCKPSSHVIFYTLTLQGCCMNGVIVSVIV